MKATLPHNEEERISELQACDILDTLPEQEYQDIVYLASLICETPIAMVSFVDRERQWFKAKIGIDAEETEREAAFCAHALLDPNALFIVPDARHDERFYDNPLVTGDSGIAFYAGAPLTTSSGLVLGTLCVIDRTPRTLTSSQQEALFALSRQVMAQLERRQEILRFKEAQAQLMHSEKMASIGQLAAGVAHEINNPVGFVSSNMSTLSNYTRTLFNLIDRYEEIVSNEPLGPQAKEEIRCLTDSAELSYLKDDMGDLVRESMEGLNRVRDIVQALRDFSHGGQADWKYSDIHLGIDNTLKIVANEIKHKAQVVKQYGDLPAVKCLLPQLNQVFMNLLVNAAQAIDRNGVITIQTSVADDWISIRISDNGSGIAPENMKRIFEPFFTSKAVGLGTGLGLSVSYNIVKKHGGRIEVESTPGVGTTFTVVLPVLPADSLS